MQDNKAIYRPQLMYLHAIMFHTILGLHPAPCQCDITSAQFSEGHVEQRTKFSKYMSAIWMLECNTDQLFKRLAL